MKIIVLPTIGIALRIRAALVVMGTIGALVTGVKIKLMRALFIGSIVARQL